MAKSKEQKSTALAMIKENIGRAKTVVFTDYKGMKMPDFDALRSDLREKEGKIEVVKITLAGIAFDDIDAFRSIVGQASLALAYGFGDEIGVPKTIKKFAKKHEQLKILGGYYEGQFISRDQMLMLANTPSKEELIVTILGSLNAPLQNLHGTLQNFAQRLVYVLKAIEEK